MKTNKKVQTNSVQKSEKENAVKVTALAIIPKPMTLLTPQDVPTATEVTETPETVTVPTITEEATAKRTHNCRSGGANHAQDTACNGNG